ncbi:Transcription factor, MADS-box [Corchorus olitorius]|uniref:Transcription factor, MADS-box n=1 Tax=Corchorus olitorius TaxID=93759 RepID=A0A1R3K3T9_9ROSI|nr:Transcription factor, MADS-box [Corchorus olitorius]
MARFPSKGYRKTRANPRAGARQAACSKRRSGFFYKASELSTISVVQRILDVLRLSLRQRIINLLHNVLQLLKLH